MTPIENRLFMVKSGEPVFGQFDEEAPFVATC